MKTYKIGTYKAGQQIAKEVFESNDLQEIRREFERIFNATKNDIIESGSFDDITFEAAWEHKHFSEDTNNVAVFEVEEGEGLHTNYTYQGCTSKLM